VFKRLFTIICGGLILGAADARSLAQTPQFVTSSLSGICGLTQAANEVKSGDPHFLPEPVVGTLTFNGAGAVTLSGSQNVAGTVKTLGGTGTYSVNADGRTGSIDLSAAGGPVIGFVIVSGGTELLFINTGTVNPTTKLLNQVMVGRCDF
jgi:hypothetical protein